MSDSAPALPPHTLHVISHTHWDREWYLPFQRFRLRLVRVVDELLSLFESTAEEDAAFRAFHLDGQAVVLEDYVEVRPGNAERLRRQIEAGRILVGPWYVLPDEFLISAESHVRNLLVGQQVVVRFGPSMRLGYLPDLFGHISQMPQILVDAGFDTAVLWRGLSGEREGLKSELWWEAPDGSRVLCVHLPEQSGYSNANNLPSAPDAALERVRTLRGERAQHATTEHLLLMNGTDHHGPQRRLPTLLRALNEYLRPEGAELMHATLPEYIAAVRGTLDLDRESSPEERATERTLRSTQHDEAGRGDESGQIDISTGEVSAAESGAGPTWHGTDSRTGLQVRRGELRDVNRSGVMYSNFLLHGVASARMYIKQANHRAQQALERFAEPWSAVAWLLGEAYPQGLLHQSWKYLLQNHPHDSICGCSVDEVHEQMMTRFQWSQEIADGLTTEALHQLARRTARPDLAEGEAGFRLYNSLPWPRDEVVEATVYLPLDGPAGRARGFVVVDASGSLLPAVIRGDREAVRTVEHSGMSPAPRHPRSRELTLAFRAKVPATGYATFGVRSVALPAFDRPAAHPADVQAGPTWLENEHLRVDVQPNGMLKLHHRATGRSFESLLAFEDGGDVGDEYTFSPPVRDRVVSSYGAQATVSVIEAGSATGRLEIAMALEVPDGAAPDRRSRCENTTQLSIRTTVTLTAGSRRLECETVVDNTARDHRLRVLFPAGVTANTHCVDQAFDVVERPNDYPATPPEFWNEDAPETHPQRLFVDLTDREGGLALLNQGIAEYGITGRAGGPRGLALTLLRCVQYLGGGAYPQTIRSGAGPHLETPGAQCPGRRTFQYALMPHVGTWEEADLVREAVAYNTPVQAYPVDDTPLPWVPTWASENQRRTAAALAAQVESDREPMLGLEESFLRIDGGALVLSAMKRAEAPDEHEGGDPGGRLVLRLYNPTSTTQQARIRLRGGISRAWCANILEQPGDELPVTGGELVLTLGPKKIVTLLIAALLEADQYSQRRPSRAAAESGVHR